MDEEIIDVTVDFFPDRADWGIFWEMYETERRFHLHELKGRKAFWGEVDRKKRVCRFCGKDSKSTSFKKEAHLIPALMGNKHLFSGYECDNCNAMFSRYENELANFSGVWHTLSRVPGRNGIPKFKDSKNNFHIEAKGDQLGIYLRNPSRGVKVDPKNNLLSINTFKPSFIPRDVLKCFLKIAFSAMSESTVAEYDKLRKWLVCEIKEEEISMHPYFYVPRAYSNKNLPSPMILLMRRRNLPIPVAMPEHILLIFYGIFIYQVYVPFNKNENDVFRKGKITLPIEEHFCTEVPSDNPLGKATVNVMNMGSRNRDKGVEENISLPFRQFKKPT